MPALLTGISSLGLSRIAALAAVSSVTSQKLRREGLGARFIDT
jgi:hypothetical protein